MFCGLLQLKGDLLQLYGEKGLFMCHLWEFLLIVQPELVDLFEVVCLQSVHGLFHLNGLFGWHMSNIDSFCDCCNVSFGDLQLIVSHLQLSVLLLFSEQLILQLLDLS